MSKFQPPPWRLLGKDFFRAMRGMFWPPTPRRLLSFMRVTGSVFSDVFHVMRDVQTGRMSVADLNERVASLERDLRTEVNKPTAQSREYSKNISRMLDTAAQWHQQVQLPRSYLREMQNWTHDVLAAPSPTELYQALDARIRLTLSGKLAPGFIPVEIDTPAPDLVTALQKGDPCCALEFIEGAPLSKMQARLPEDSTIALVHTVVCDEGVYAIITPQIGKPQMLLCSNSTRQEVKNLLRGWLWLYYFHSKDIFGQLLDYLFASPNIPKEQKEAFKKGGWRYPYLKILYSQAVAENLQPTEVPVGGARMLVPFASWLLMEGILREIGEGYLVPGKGLWKTIDSRLREMGIERIVMCPDPALALLPHHAAILNVDENGEKEHLLDRYVVTYLPQGTVAAPHRSAKRIEQLIALGTEREPWSEIGLKSLEQIERKRMTILPRAPSRDAWDEIGVELEQYQGLSFLGHGKYIWDQPEASLMALALDRDGIGFDFTLGLESFLEQIPERMELVTLAACELGMRGFRTQTTLRGFAEDLLRERQVRSIVSTLWPIPRVATLLMILKFHEYLLTKDVTLEHESLPIASALRRAQLDLRGLTRTELISKLAQLPATDSPQVREEISNARDEVLEQPYAHPYFWANLYAMGDL